MPFQALTGAPSLRDGVRLNIMPYPQDAGSTPERLSVGAVVTLRLGHCCPLVKQGRITAIDETRAVLSLEGESWRLEPVDDGVTIPGIVSGDWIVHSG